jgi:hypothetical protein
MKRRIERAAWLWAVADERLPDRRLLRLRALEGYRLPLSAASGYSCPKFIAGALHFATVI